VRDRRNSSKKLYKEQFCVVEMVNGEWYAHFVLKKEVELPDEPETLVWIWVERSYCCCNL